MNGKKQKQNLIFSVIFLMLAAAVMVTVIFGWFVISRKPEIAPFNVKVISRNTFVTFELVDIEGEGDELRLEKITPGKQFKFIIKLDNTGEQDSYYNIYFSGLSSDIEQYDMEGIFSVKRDEQTNYFRELDSEGKILIADNESVPPLTEKTIVFNLVFETAYMYYDEDEQPVYDDSKETINMFQGKQFYINTLVVEID
ncbi:MAG: hypothetical protein PHE12_02900 [Clostridia bacterium]|nr:hypothetical protein [Clostridia bacterium]